MIGYTFKVYLSKSKEHFAFGETETASSPLTEKGAVKKVPPPGGGVGGGGGRGGGRVGCGGGGG